MAPLSLPFTARRTAVPGMLLLEGQRPVERVAQGAAGLLGQVLAVTEDTTVVVDQAENRLHAQKALLSFLLRESRP